MIQLVTHSVRFILFALTQALIFNQLEVGFGVQFMIYPLFILLLPQNMNIFLSMFVSFLLGLTIDSISNTYGLHASSALLIAYLRPMFFKRFEPRDGYEQETELSFDNMEFKWILYVHGILLAIHHIWFFTVEVFKLNEVLYILQKSLISLPCSFVLCILIQMIFVKKSVSR